MIDVTIVFMIDDLSRGECAARNRLVRRDVSCYSYINLGRSRRKTGALPSFNTDVYR